MKSFFADRDRIPNWVFVAIASIPLLGWWRYGLFDLDEGFYGAVTAEMNRRGEWITPYYNGQPWFEKPIFLYWLAKPCLLLFGDAVGPRLPCILATVALYALVGWVGRRRFSPDVAKLAVLALGSSLLVVGAGRMMLTDPLLVLALSISFFALWESLVGDRRWRMVSAVGLGVSVLAKGPVGILLFLPLLGVTYWREPELRDKFRGGWFTFLGILGAVAAIWYVPAYLRNGSMFVQKFLVEQNLQRFTGGDAAHTVKNPLQYLFFVVVLLAGFFPWSLTLPGIFRRDRAKELDAFERFLMAWAAIVFGFFTLSGAKLVHYILPMGPPVVLLAARQLTERSRWSLSKWLGLAVGWTACIAVIANVGFIGWYHSSGQDSAHRLIREVRDEPNLVLYQVGRREADPGTGTTNLRETSLPSLILYANRSIPETDALKDLVGMPKPLVVFTRENRISPADIQTLSAEGIITQTVKSYPGFIALRLTKR